MGDSILRMKAALAQVSTESKLKVSSAEILDDGSVKLKLVDYKQSCRAVIFNIGLGNNDADYVATNPQRASCK